MKAALRLRTAIPLLIGLVVTAPLAAQGIPAGRVPVRTALAEISTTRQAYQDAFNKHDYAALSAMYAPDAVVLAVDGRTYSGRDAIREALTAAPHSTITLTSNSVKVFGATAYDIGTIRTTNDDGTTSNAQYLVVTRRDRNNWLLTSVAVIPEAPPAK
ncbi:MAG: nuclear transport factor 2 family protein [Gemmatimonadales bacterium]|nr:nuclear transport factor 2 family protein [Gemmatimonadales bacterium]